jgi:NUMOD4 motif/HNH endonuclease
MAKPPAPPEVWLPVLGYEGYYEVSNLGRVHRVGVNSGDGFLKPSTTHGYLHVSLSRDGDIRTHRVHVMVLSAFCGPAPFPGAQAAHNDGDQANCRLTNLRWATGIENQADVERHGRRCKGEDVFGVVLTEKDVRVIRQHIANGDRNRPIAERFSVSTSTIHLIRHNRIWRHVA